MFALCRTYLRDTRGHFAVQFALLGLPLIMATTFVVDYAGAGTEKVKVKTALDAAVIAAVNNDALSLSAKEAFAVKHFSENYSGDISFELKPKAEDDRVEMSAFGTSPVTVSETLGIDGIEIFEKSTAQTFDENVICVLSLAEDGKERILFEDSISFMAPTCTVHSNSKDSESIVSKSSVTPVAKSFCTVGGATGDFKPYAKGECRPIADPYAHVKPAMESAKCELGKRGNKDEYEIIGPEIKWEEGDPAVPQFNPRDETPGSYVTLKPGTYCGGLKVIGENVKFEPGDYVILDGKLNFRDGASAWGEDVTFTMKSTEKKKESRLEIENGSSVYFKAPRFGERKGLIFMEHIVYDPGKKSNNLIENEIEDGAVFTAVGTLYFPTQAIIVKGNGADMGARAPATSFIAYEIDFTSKNHGSKVSVAVDHVAAGLPPVLPRAEDGARLVE